MDLLNLARLILDGTFFYGKGNVEELLVTKGQELGERDGRGGGVEEGGQCLYSSEECGGQSSVWGSLSTKKAEGQVAWFRLTLGPQIVQSAHALLYYSHVRRSPGRHFILGRVTSGQCGLEAGKGDVLRDTDRQTAETESQTDRERVGEIKLYFSTVKERERQRQGAGHNSQNVQD